MDFVGGFNDGFTPTGWITRNATGALYGYYGVDEESDAYFYGEVSGTVAGFLVPGAKGVKTYANAVDGAGDCANWLSKLWRGGCFVAGTPVSVAQLPWNATHQAAIWDDAFVDRADRFAASIEGTSAVEFSSVATAASCQQQLLIPIEDIPLGARILTKNPRPWDYDDSLPEPDEETWVKISLTMHRTDGGIVDAEILRPRAWIDFHGIVAGKLLPMHIEELQVRGSVLVTAIEESPEIADGEGSVVTARFLTREVHEIARVEILGPNGQRDRIEGTSIHPIWSEDRQDWIPLGELRPGETLRAAIGDAVVQTVELLSQAVPVYNIEVHGEHVYEVGSSIIVVHNSYAVTNVSELFGRQLKSEYTGSVIKRLKKSMLANGFDPNHPIEVVIVNGKKIIWDGHHRARAAGAAGIREVPTKIIEKSPEVMRQLFEQAAHAAEQLGLPF